jgi:hypothetical protein
MSVPRQDSGNASVAYQTLLKRVLIPNLENRGPQSDLHVYCRIDSEDLGDAAIGINPELLPHFLLSITAESAVPKSQGRELPVVQEPPLSHNVALLSVTIC